jgi:hypothetical protein
MPWSVSRSDTTVTVDLSLPIEDWDAVLRDIEERLAPMPRAVFLPATLAHATPLDLDLLNKLWSTLRSQGMPLRPLP